MPTRSRLRAVATKRHYGGPDPRLFRHGDASESARLEAQRARADFKCESAWRLIPPIGFQQWPRRWVAKALCGNDDRMIRQGQHSTAKGVKSRGRFTGRHSAAGSDVSNAGEEGK
jgi:hypothetical protein